MVPVFREALVKDRCGRGTELDILDGIKPQQCIRDVSHRPSSDRKQLAQSVFRRASHIPSTISESVPSVRLAFLLTLSVASVANWCCSSRCGSANGSPSALDSVVMIFVYQMHAGEEWWPDRRGLFCFGRQR